LFVVFLASAAAPLNQFKVPPMMPPLMESFQLDLSMAGLLISVFAVTGFILALPAGLILQRLGPKAAGLIAAGSCSRAWRVNVGSTVTTGCLPLEVMGRGLGEGYSE
jgi:MFS family permease